MERCKGLVGFILGHNFQPVITKGAPTGEFKADKASEWLFLSFTEASKPEICHGLYCRRCGLRHE